MISFAGIRSDEMHVIVEHYPSHKIPEVSYEVISVPGRDDDIVIPNGNLKNYRETYSIFLESDDMETEMYQRIVRSLGEWLIGHPGYQRLEDSYDPECYRMAYYSGGTDFTNFFNVYGRGSLEFTCAPRRFYKDGEKAINITASTILINPSVFESDPIYQISGSSITVNGNTMTFGSNGVVIDVKNHTSKTPLGVSVTVLSGTYESLRLGKTNTFGGDYIVTPRWWTI